MNSISRWLMMLALPLFVLACNNNKESERAVATANDAAGKAAALAGDMQKNYGVVVADGYVEASSINIERLSLSQSIEVRDKLLEFIQQARVFLSFRGDGVKYIDSSDVTAEHQMRNARTLLQEVNAHIEDLNASSASINMRPGIPRHRPNHDRR